MNRPTKILHLVRSARDAAHRAVRYDSPFDRRATELLERSALLLDDTLAALRPQARSLACVEGNRLRREKRDDMRRRRSEVDAAVRRMERAVEGAFARAGT